MALTVKGDIHNLRQLAAIRGRKLIREQKINDDAFRRLQGKPRKKVGEIRS